MIWTAIVGFVVGLIARAILPGAQNLGIILTALLGIAGSFLASFVMQSMDSAKQWACWVQWLAPWSCSSSSGRSRVPARTLQRPQFDANTEGRGQRRHRAWLECRASGCSAVW